MTLYINVQFLALCRSLSTRTRGVSSVDRVPSLDLPKYCTNYHQKNERFLHLWILVRKTLNVIQTSAQLRIASLIYVCMFGTMHSQQEIGEIRANPRKSIIPQVEFLVERRLSEAPQRSGENRLIRNVISAPRSPALRAIDPQYDRH